MNKSLICGLIAAALASITIWSGSGVLVPFVILCSIVAVASSIDGDF
jgi:hypothetical protein